LFAERKTAFGECFVRVLLIMTKVSIYETPIAERWTDDDLDFMEVSSSKFAFFFFFLLVSHHRVGMA
jgi:hypothetical protein